MYWNLVMLSLHLYVGRADYMHLGYGHYFCNHLHSLYWVITAGSLYACMPALLQYGLYIYDWTCAMCMWGACKHALSAVACLLPDWHVTHVEPRLATSHYCSSWLSNCLENCLKNCYFNVTQSHGLIQQAQYFRATERWHWAVYTPLGQFPVRQWIKLNSWQEVGTRAACYNIFVRNPGLLPGERIESDSLTHLCRNIMHT